MVLIRGRLMRWPWTPGVASKAKERPWRVFEAVRGVLRIEAANDGVVEVVPDGDGVQYLRADGTVSPAFRWDHVDEIRTFKRDLGTYDDIRLAFAAGGSWYEIGEDVKGFGRLSDAMREHFPSIPAGWYGDVMLPAFATNERVLYRRVEVVGDGPRARDIP